MGLRGFLILTALALASCGGGSPPAASKSAPPAPEDIAAGNTVPDEAEPPSVEPSPTPGPAPAASNEASVAAPTSARFQLGKHYARLSPTQPTSSSPDKVEVAEIFWYGCPHCYALEPALNAWLKNKANYIEFVRVPVTWGEVHRAHARLFYTLKALNKLDALHDKVFDAIHLDHQPLFAPGDPLETQREQLKFAKDNGIGEADFTKAYSDFSVQS
ncbi:MAG TPA: hypothetical protein VMV37_01090, partial [Gammaproteobacteria bacterium]|nr:hypothetical protein [Gammaproteobacteria bacterium]